MVNLSELKAQRDKLKQQFRDQLVALETLKAAMQETEDTLHDINEEITAVLEATIANNQKYLRP